MMEETSRTNFAIQKKREKMTENEDEKKWADFEKRMRAATKSIHDIQDKAITGNYENYYLHSCGTQPAHENTLELDNDAKPNQI